jgi:hypothetical protein
MSYATLAETALVLPLDGLPPALKALRAANDPTVAMGVPPHVTALIPFHPLAQITPAHHAKIAAWAAVTPALTVRFTALGRFPGSLHLLPETPAPLVEAITGLATLFAECPPYDGQFDEVIPHVTLAAGPEDALDRCAEGAAPHLGFLATLRALFLLYREGTAWHLFRRFDLRRPAS